MKDDQYRSGIMGGKGVATVVGIGEGLLILKTAQGRLLPWIPLNKLLSFELTMHRFLYFLSLFFFLLWQENPIIHVWFG